MSKASKNTVNFYVRIIIILLPSEKRSSLLLR